LYPYEEDDQNENTNTNDKIENPDKVDENLDNCNSEVQKTSETRCLPKKIIGKVVDFETFQIYDEEVRKRFKFLNHLPEGTTVYLVEVDLRSMHVAESDKISRHIKFSKEAVKKVKPAIDKRRRLRNERKREEQSYEQKYLESQMEELYMFDDSQFPTVYNDQQTYNNNESFPDLIEQSPQPTNASISSSSSLANQIKMGSSMPGAPLSTPSFGFAARMRNSGMSLLPESTPETYDTNGNNVSLNRAGTPPSCVQFVIKTKKTKGKKKRK